MLSATNIREAKIVISVCVVTALVIGMSSENSLLKQYQHPKQYQQQSRQQYIPNNDQGFASILSSEKVEFSNPFKFYNPQYLRNNNYAIPNDIEDVMMNKMPPIPAAYANLDDVEYGTRISSAGEDTKNNQHNEQPIQTEEGDKQQQQGEYAMPFFWHIPRSAGATFAQIFGECLGLTLASSESCTSSSSRSTTSFESIFSKNDNPTLGVIRHQESKYLSINLETNEGILKAKQLDIFKLRDETNTRPLVDVILSPSVYEVSQVLFAPPEEISSSDQLHLTPKGHLFTMLRHPVEREISYFYNLKQNKGSAIPSLHHQQQQLEMKDLEIYEMYDWIKSPYFLDNIMVRSLIYNFDRSYQVTVNDLLVAKEILRRKCLIGLLEEKQSSLLRVKQYFQNEQREQKDQKKEGDSKKEDGAKSGGDKMKHDARRFGSTEECEEKLLDWGWINKNPNRPHVDHDILEMLNGNMNYGVGSIGETVDGKSYELVKLENRWDVLLYEYARYLFHEQGTLFGYDRNENDGTSTLS